MLDEKGYMRIGSTSSKPFILSDNIFEKHPRINHNVQIDGKIVGWIDVLCNSPTDYTEQDIQFIATFCRAISLEFQRQNYKIKQIDNSYVRALSYLFEGIDIQDAQIRQTLDFYRKKEMRENYSVLAIKPKKADASDEKR
jgi:hypothetical protein